MAFRYNFKRLKNNEVVHMVRGYFGAHSKNHDLQRKKFLKEHHLKRKDIL